MPLFLNSLGLLAALSISSMAAQQPLKTWTLQISDKWDVLGPFPINAREQHFISPSFPLNLSVPVDYNESWPSSYADGGKVSWSQFQSDENGNIRVSYPNIRWSILRATEGWAALQHHSVLRSTLTVYPPTGPYSHHKPPRLRVKLVQGSFITVVPLGTSNDPPRWYSGNIYDLEQAPVQIIELPTVPSTDSSTTYDIFVSGDYEIRLFGDPKGYSLDDTPILSIVVEVTLDDSWDGVVWDPTQDVICDFVDGYAFGDALGFGLRSVDGWWTVTSAVLARPMDGLSIDLLHEVRLAPTQTRTIPLRIAQSSPIKVTEKALDIIVTVVSEGSSVNLNVVLPLQYHSLWTPETFKPIKASYLFSHSMPTAFLVLPPMEQRDANASHPPILALHGAGVKELEQTFWADSLARQRKSWVIMPTGRTSWGLDWHGSSAQDAWSSVDALADITNRNINWRPWCFSKNNPVVLMGHSNGGQGAWYLASRYPDRVLAVVPAAGYIKSQSYVPVTMSRSARFIDPSLRAILDTALTPDDNDLFMTNLVDTPILAIHGGADDIVPAWHSREAISILKTWNPEANVTYLERSGRPHWWPSVLNNEEVQSFIDSVSQSALNARMHSRAFTLTVAIPAESGSLHGWQIESLQVPGRLARLRVQDDDGTVTVHTTNVHTFSLDLDVFNFHTLAINGEQVSIPPCTTGKIWFPKGLSHSPQQLSGRMQVIINSAAPLVLVIPDQISSPVLSIALRIAHDLNKYHKLDSEIIRSSEAMHRAEGDCLGAGNIVLLGDASLAFGHWCFSKISSSFETMPREIREKMLGVQNPATGFMSLLSHPTNPDANMLIMNGDQPALERTARLFPIRTGISVPDWLLITANADQMGTGGIVATGQVPSLLRWTSINSIGSLWARNWTWDNRCSSY